MAFTSGGTYRYNDSIWTKINLLPEYKGGECSEIVFADSGLYMNYENAPIFKKKDSPPVLLAKDTTDRTEFFCSQLMKIRGKVYAAIHNQLFELIHGKMHLLIDSIPAQHFFNYTIDTGKYLLG